MGSQPPGMRLLDVNAQAGYDHLDWRQHGVGKRRRQNGFLAELVRMLWLLARGADVQRWNEVVAA